METPSHYGKPQQYHGSLKEKIPAHMIIPRKFPIIPRKLKREDTGTYDNTAEASDNTTTYFHIMDYKDCCCLLLLPVFSYNGLLLSTTTCFHIMDRKDCCCIPQPVTI